MKQHPGILLVAPANTPAIVNPPRLKRQRTIFDQFRQLFGVLALLAAGMAQAAPVTYYFGGQLEYVDPFLSPSLAVGNGFSGTLTYESTTADSAPADLNRGYYYTSPALAVTINGLPFSVASGGNSSVVVINDLSGTDNFLISASFGGSATTGASINGYIPVAFLLLMDDYTGSAFSSDALPTSEVDLTLFDVSRFEFFLENRRSLHPDVYVNGSLGYLSLTDPRAATIPEPGSMLLIALSICALAACRRKIARFKLSGLPNLSPISQKAKVWSQKNIGSLFHSRIRFGAVAIITAFIFPATVQAATYRAYGQSGGISFLNEGSVDEGIVNHDIPGSRTKIITEGIPSVFSEIYKWDENGGSAAAGLSYRVMVIGASDTTIGIGFRGAYKLYSSLGRGIEEGHESSASIAVNLVSSMNEETFTESRAGFGAKITNLSTFGIGQNLESYLTYYPTQIEFSPGGNIGGGSTSYRYGFDRDFGSYEDFNSLFGYFDGTINFRLNSDGRGYVDVGLGAIAYGVSLDDVARAFVDPYIYIDPLYLLDYPTAHLDFEPGVGNNPVAGFGSEQQIPEPSTASLIILALLITLRGRRIFKQIRPRQMERAIVPNPISLSRT